jgi:hypothetical protein
MKRYCLTRDLIEEYHITAYVLQMPFFLQKHDIVHLNSKKVTCKIIEHLFYCGASLYA